MSVNLSEVWHTSRVVVYEVKWQRRLQRGRALFRQLNDQRTLQSRRYIMLPVHDIDKVHVMTVKMKMTLKTASLHAIIKCM